jgi:hypothetical protein
MFRINEIFDPEAKVLNIDLIGKLPEKYRNQFENFFRNYEVERLEYDMKKNRRRLKKKADRVCRFCGKKRPEVTFDRTAHLIPKLIGNRFLISDFECDSCNEWFGINLENDLANFLGITRSFDPRNDKAKTPFSTPDNTLIVTEGYLDENDKELKKVIKSLDINKKHFTLDEKNKRIVLHSTKHPYTPINVYRAILKIALSVIDQSYVEDYAKAFDFLKGDPKTIIPQKGFYRCATYLCPGMTFPSPLVFLFKKKDPNSTMPTHLMNVYFLNYIYQIALPFYLPDKWMYDGKTQLQFHLAPPLIDENWGKNYGFPSQEVIDLFETEIVKNAKHDTVFQFNSAEVFRHDPNMFFPELGDQPQESQAD